MLLKRTEKVELQIEGMTCAHCEQSVKRALEALPQVREAVVSAAAGTATLKVEAGKPLERAALAKAIAEAGYRLKQ